MVLGPLLFTLYINELADLQLTEGFKVVAYADDLLLYKPIESTTDFGKIQEDMHVTAIRNWMSCNFLTLNASKCNYMLVSQRKERSLLEDVQKFACKVCCKNWHMDYESMLTY